MKERHFFAGNNTAEGFFSYFDYIMNLEEANHYYILKGGPGVGKSSFMKKFASNMASLGHAIEYVHCSSDRESYDAIVVPALKIGFVDGTAPHTIDPKYPGAVDEIINLGFFFDGSKIVDHKKEVIQASKEKTQTYKSAYRYLAAASLILEDVNWVYDTLTDDLKFYRICEEVINDLLQKEAQSRQKEELGYIRKLFSESYTADGYISFTDSLCAETKVWAVNGKNINYVSKLMDEVTKKALLNGLDVECFYRPLTPNKIQHLFLPELNLMIRSVEDDIKGNFDRLIDLNKIMDTTVLKGQLSIIQSKEKEYETLVNMALDKLSQTKKLHDRLEKIYVDSMNFNGVNQYFDTILAKYK